MSAPLGWVATYLVVGRQIEAGVVVTPLLSHLRTGRSQLSTKSQKNELSRNKIVIKYRRHYAAPA